MMRAPFRQISVLATVGFVVMLSPTGACTRRVPTPPEDALPGPTDVARPVAPRVAADAAADTRPPLPPMIRNWTLAVEVGPASEPEERTAFLAGDAYQLLDDDGNVVRSIPMLLCEKGPRGKGVPAHTLVACRKKRERGSRWLRLTFQQIDYNKSYTLVAHFDPEHGAGGDQDMFTHQSPRQLDASQ